MELASSGPKLTQGTKDTGLSNGLQEGRYYGQESQRFPGPPLLCWGVFLQAAFSSARGGSGSGRVWKWRGGEGWKAGS